MPRVTGKLGTPRAMQACYLQEPASLTLCFPLCAALVSFAAILILRLRPLGSLHQHISKYPSLEHRASRAPARTQLLQLDSSHAACSNGAPAAAMDGDGLRWSVMECDGLPWSVMECDGDAVIQ